MYAPNALFMHHVAVSAAAWCVVKTVFGARVWERIYASVVDSCVPNAIVLSSQMKFSYATTTHARAKSFVWVVLLRKREHVRSVGKIIARSVLKRQEDTAVIVATIISVKAVMNQGLMVKREHARSAGKSIARSVLKMQENTVIIATVISVTAVMNQRCAKNAHIFFVPNVMTRN